ncbi:hypothetical protein [Stenotrophomonas sp. SY1]|uniref:hypothetical protein n=1 Tax=Stenotrophomonas sp. SY1 TaxID=477235 RepID=UPI001E3EE4FE|nr:hypothetical protein [Stenotrophomonas sp. SY1]MCD9086237.1 hypothetical protein [Stenotrophomonas sp. SY1]
MPQVDYRESLREMDDALAVLVAMVPQAQRVPFHRHFVYRYVERLPVQAIVQKLARLPSGLRAAQVLLGAGFFQEQGALQRMLDELVDDVLFLSIPLLSGEWESIHDNFLDAFFTEDFDPATGQPTAQDRPMVPRKKIRAYIARSKLGGANPSGQIDAGRTLSKVYSGFVHAASPHIMELYGGDPPHFHTAGMLGTPGEQGHQDDMGNYYYRGLSAFVVAAHAFGNRPLFDRLYAFSTGLGDVVGRRDQGRSQ